MHIGRLAFALGLVALAIAAASPSLGAARGIARVLLIVGALALAASWIIEFLLRRRRR